MSDVFNTQMDDEQAQPAASTAEDGASDAVSEAAERILMRIASVKARMKNQSLPPVEALNEVLTAVADEYDTLSSDIRSVANVAIDKILPKVAPDLALPLSAFVRLAANVASSDAQVQAHQAFSKAMAGRRMSAVQAYMDAGFSHDEAIAFVMNDTAKGQSNLPLWAMALGVLAANSD